MQTEQNYFRDKARWHNRVFHGYGVAHGLKVSVGEGEGAPSVVVGPGQALDRYGRELELCSPVRFRLPKSAASVLVLARYVEHLTDEAPAGKSDREKFGTLWKASLPKGPQATRVEEGCEIVLAEQTGSSSKPAKSNAATSDSVNVVLARLIRTQRGWRLDRRLKVPRTR